MNINSAISIIESVDGFCDESTPCGEAWAFILGILNTDIQSTAQQTDTCKYRLSKAKTGFLAGAIISPHDGSYLATFQEDCPTCGKRIEVVE